MENNVKNTIKNYLENCNENDLYEISKNIFNSFVDKDDENIIKAVKFLIKTYSFYSEMNLRKKLNQWRFNIIDDDNNNFKNKKRSNSKNKNEIKKNNKNKKVGIEVEKCDTNGNKIIANNSNISKRKKKYKCLFCCFNNNNSLSDNE